MMKHFVRLVIVSIVYTMLFAASYIGIGSWFSQATIHEFVFDVMPLWFHIYASITAVVTAVAVGYLLGYLGWLEPPQYKKI